MSKAPEKFEKKVIEKSESKNLAEALQGEFIEAEQRVVQQGEDVCCACGKQLKAGWKVYYIWNVKNRESLTIGSCCVNKCAALHHWRSKEEYLLNALRMARNKQEESFVKSLINRLTKYDGRLKITERQAKWLRDITGKEWTWSLW